MKTENIRNFCIIAHIDHGKSTLADRLLEITNTIPPEKMREQVLDNMDLERERGITIKSHAVQMKYNYKGEEYILNLIDTPGHVDFSYEVSRAIASSEGALLVVDVSQGIQAQTIANLYKALEYNLVIIPILNKMDLPFIKPDEIKEQICELLGCPKEEIIEASAKTGMGVEKIIQRIIEKIPPPKGNVNSPLQALIFDSVFNPYRGIIIYFRVFNGIIKKGDHVKFFNTNKDYIVEEVGILKLKYVPCEQIEAGNVGYLISGIKNAQEVKVGDTITHYKNPCSEPIAGFSDVKPMVFAGIYPTDPSDYENLRSALEKLKLNDASISFTPENSSALGFGFRCGFLGLLHMEIIQERLEREYNLNVIATLPNVSYKVITTKNEIIEVKNPSELPHPTQIKEILEPFVLAQIITKSDFVGPMINLCISRRGILKNQTYLTADKVEILFEFPLSEIVFDFYDKLKSFSKGYASFDYQFLEYRPAKLVKLDILLNGDQVDALSTLIHYDHAYEYGRKICEKLKELIPRQQFEVAIQAAIGSRVIARETIKPLRKDVTAKCYGGDVTRKKKLLEKQKRGKKKLKQIGTVEVPQEAFLALLKINKNT